MFLFIGATNHINAFFLACLYNRFVQSKTGFTHQGASSQLSPPSSMTQNFDSSLISFILLGF